MDDFNDDLEVGIAAGLDVPTALALSDSEPPRPKGGGCGWGLLIGVALVVLMTLLRLL